MHSNVPDEQTSYEQGGWQEYYFEPMKAYFSEMNAKGVTEKAKAAAPKTNGGIMHTFRIVSVVEMD